MSAYAGGDKEGQGDRYFVPLAGQSTCPLVPPGGMKIMVFSRNEILDIMKNEQYPLSSKMLLSLRSDTGIGDH